MDPNTQTPDLQAATGMTPQAPLTGPSILQALGSIQGPSPGLAAGSGMLNSLGGGPPGANPYLQQHQQAQRGTVQQIDQVRQVQQQQMQQQMMMEQLRQRNNEMKLRQHQAELSVAQTLIKLDTPEARMTGGKMIAETLKNMGRGEAVGLAEGLAKGRLSHADMEDVFRGALRGLSDQALMEQYPGLNRKLLAEVRSNIGNDDVRKTFSYKTKAEAEREKLDLQAKDTEVLNKEWGNLPPDLMARIDAMHIADTGKVPVKGDAITRAAAFQKAYTGWEKERLDKEARAEAMVKNSLASEDRRERLMAMQNSFLQRMGSGPGGQMPGYDMSISAGPRGVTYNYAPMKETRKELAGLEQTEQILTEVDEMSKRLITADTWPKALVQGAALQGGALVGSNEIARVYRDKKQGLLSIIAKTLGKETGVLTDRDITRVSDMLPGFSDTIAVRDMKMGFLTSLMDTTKEVQQAIYDKKEIPKGVRAKVLKVLADSEKARGVPRHLRVISPDGKTGTYTLGPHESLPPGFKEVSE